MTGPEARRVIRVVGYALVDDFRWFCHACREYSESQPSAQLAYGLAVGHARWHGWGGDVISLGWPADDLPPVRDVPL